MWHPSPSFEGEGRLLRSGFQLFESYGGSDTLNFADWPSVI